jgi:hypothetical protein
VITPPARADVTSFTTSRGGKRRLMREPVCHPAKTAPSQTARACPATCSPCFIWFRSGIRNSFNHNLAPADGVEALDYMM